MVVAGRGAVAPPADAADVRRDAERAGLRVDADGRDRRVDAEPREPHPLAARRVACDRARRAAPCRRARRGSAARPVRSRPRSRTRPGRRRRSRSPRSARGTRRSPARRTVAFGELNVPSPVASTSPFQYGAPSQSMSARDAYGPNSATSTVAGVSPRPVDGQRVEDLVIRLDHGVRRDRGDLRRGAFAIVVSDDLAAGRDHGLVRLGRRDRLAVGVVAGRASVTGGVGVRAVTGHGQRAGPERRALAADRLAAARTGPTARH